MPKRGRPPKAGQRRTYYIKLTLWEGEDDDLIAFLEGIPPRGLAAAVKTALLNGGANLTLTASEEELADEDLEAFFFEEVDGDF